MKMVNHKNVSTCVHVCTCVLSVVWVHVCMCVECGVYVSVYLCACMLSVGVYVSASVLSVVCT